MSVDKAKILEAIFLLRDDIMNNPIAQSSRVVHQETINGNEYFYRLEVTNHALMHALMPEEWPDKDALPIKGDDQC